MRLKGKPRSEAAGPRVKGWEAALVLRLRSLPRERAPAHLGERILAAIAALEKEVNDHETTHDPRNGPIPRRLL